METSRFKIGGDTYPLKKGENGIFISIKVGPTARIRTDDKISIERMRGGAKIMGCITKFVASSYISK